MIDWLGTPQTTTGRLAVLRMVAKRVTSLVRAGPPQQGAMIKMLLVFILRVRWVRLTVLVAVPDLVLVTIGMCFVVMWMILLIIR